MLRYNTVQIGKSVPLLDDLGLYSGYGVNTRAASCAWIDLDDVKLAKLDQNSEISIEKEGKALDIELKSGSLYFDVSQPLGDDETLNIRTSTMLVGIRGTCGWVEDIGTAAFLYCDGLTDVYFGGSMSLWDEISIGNNNECLTLAAIHCTDGDYLHEGVGVFSRARFMGYAMPEPPPQGNRVKECPAAL